MVNEKQVLMEQKEAIEKRNVDVYSRIVGYYRPVSNWNKGKKQEYDERKMFNIDEQRVYSISKRILFWKTNCPQCVPVKNHLKDTDVEFINLDEQPEYIEQYSLMSTPTLVELDANGEMVNKVTSF